MLREFPNVRQEASGFRRLFTDEYFDLYVWYRRRWGPITGFQLCYDKGRTYRVLTWTVERGYRHEAVDDGEPSAGGHKRTPLLVEDGELDAPSMLMRFRAASRGVPRKIRRLVERVLIDYRLPPAVKAS